MDGLVMLDLSGQPEDLLFGVVRFEPGGSDRPRPRDCVITFDSARSADRFAAEKGWSGYQVIPLRFFVADLAPPAGSQVWLDAAFARLAERQGGRR